MFPINIPIGITFNEAVIYVNDVTEAYAYQRLLSYIPNSAETVKALQGYMFTCLRDKFFENFASDEHGIIIRNEVALPKKIYFGFVSEITIVMQEMELARIFRNICLNLGLKHSAKKIAQGIIANKKILRKGT